MNVRAMVSGHMVNLLLVESNIKTVWVEIAGNIIKRHRVKHRVREILDSAELSLPPGDMAVIHGDRISFYTPWYIRMWHWVIRLIKGEQ